MAGELTKQAFEEAYARRSKVTVEWLRSKGRQGYPCECGEDICEGWAMLSTEEFESREERRSPPAGAMTMDELLGDDVAELIRHNKVPPAGGVS